MWIHAQLDYTAAVATTPAWIIVTGATRDIGPGYATNAMESDHTIMYYGDTVTRSHCGAPVPVWTIKLLRAK